MSGAIAYRRRVINDAGVLADCLVGTTLAGREVSRHEMSETGDLLLAVQIEEAELLPAWSAARALVDRTGRWPVVSNVGIFPRPSIDVSTLEICSEHPEHTSPEDRGLLGERVFADVRAAQEQAGKPADLESRLPYQLTRTRARRGSAPEPAEILDRFPSDVRDSELERWLMEWEEHRQSTTEPLDSWHLDWFFDAGSPLMFYPTPSGPCSIAYAPFYGEQGGMTGLTTERLITILEFWRRTYGAELVANWGTMLQFVVAQPPTNLEDAWNLALQQALVAQDTLTGPGITLRDHARTLIARPTWFLHCRP